jgi:hypothetical protein
MGEADVIAILKQRLLLLQTITLSFTSTPVHAAACKISPLLPLLLAEVAYTAPIAVQSSSPSTGTIGPIHGNVDAVELVEAGY